jgi:hypothetical protein
MMQPYEITQGYTDAAKLIMTARTQVWPVQPLHEKLVRVSNYIDRETAEVLTQVLTQ